MLAGRLGHISETLPWLRFLMSHVYSSMAYAPAVSQSHLICTIKEFRELIRFLKTARLPTKNKSDNSDSTLQYEEEKEKRKITFALSVTAKAVHKTGLPIHINKTLREELHLITRALSADWINFSRPIGHMIKHTPSGIGHSDSCLCAAGGFSVDM